MPNSTTRSTRLTIRIPNDLRAQLEAEAAARGEDVSVATVLIEWARAGRLTRSGAATGAGAPHDPC